MNFDFVMDSWAWVELFRGTQKGTRIAKLIQNKRVAVTQHTIAELADKFYRDGIPFDTALEHIKSSATILNLTEEIILKAPEVKAEMRKKHPNASLADAINLTTAQMHNAKAVSGDSDFKDIPDAIFIK
ncbi:PIN domain-containing protein [Candidatus Woesearchaeota archaeon]|nr:PIN domain-containing protein [Candidatus Woesearchaeota archaeon]